MNIKLGCDIIKIATNRRKSCTHYVSIWLSNWCWYWPLCGKYLR